MLPVPTVPVAVGTTDVLVATAVVVGVAVLVAVSAAVVGVRLKLTVLLERLISPGATTVPITVCKFAGTPSNAAVGVPVTEIAGRISPGLIGKGPIYVAVTRVPEVTKDQPLVAEAVRPVKPVGNVIVAINGVGKVVKGVAEAALEAVNV